MHSTRRITGRVVVFGLGSNLGRREANLQMAAKAIELLDGVVPLGRSSVYETPPAGGPTQGDYLNAAVGVATDLPLAVLMEAALVIERSLGRVRPDAVRWGPRSIDIDLLWCSTETSDEQHVLVPHPRLVERAFALQPLLELVPDARDPRLAAPYSDAPMARAAILRLGSF